MDQDRLDNEQRQMSDYEAHIKQKENELEESIQRLDKLNEYIRFVVRLVFITRTGRVGWCGSMFTTVCLAGGQVKNERSQSDREIT